MSTNSTASPGGAASDGKESAGPGELVGRWRIERTIGQGTYGKVRLGVDPVTGEKVAVKVIEKAQVQSSKQIARLQREIRFLRLLHHPHIVQVYDVNETELFIYIIMEYASGGELFDYIVAHKRVKEKEARSFFRQVLSAVDYCHKNAVIHRDLKPENLLLDETKTIKIIDFGFGNNFTMEGLLDTFCGSPFYAAPEMILGKKYEGPEVDMWSLGVILFALLCGHLPFDDDNMKELYRKIASGSYTCPDYLMPSARHLISRLITVDPKKRATLDEVLVHPWVNEGYDCPPPNYLPERPKISDPSTLSKEILQRLFVFGYTMDDVTKAFGPEADQSKPSPVRATYFLLKEMLAREESKLRADRRKSTTAARRLSASSPNIAVPPPGAAVYAEKASQEEEPKVPLAVSTKGVTPASRKEHFASLQALSTILKDRRASTPDAYNRRSLPLNSPMPEIPSESDSPTSPTRPLSLQPPPTAKTRPTTAHEKPLPPGSTPPAIPLPPTPSTQDDSQKDWTRRFSSPQPPAQTPSSASTRRGSAAASSAVSSTTRFRTDLRAVSGWFFNVSTTSSKKPLEILDQVQKVLEDARIAYSVEAPPEESNPETPITLLCELDTSNLTAQEREKEEDERPPSPISPEKKHLQTHTISFQITIYKLPRMNLSGLHFKRLHGGVWSYKKVCNRLLGQMSL
ncbi:CAMK/CAMKL/MARK protein kinase [Spizellomyces punctatus DAOM BR117]|uniref:non-specific serine/threonine protein kinase n=1 Tax=Spizellomyces punctatus (strain DAOM BR117) TaxID=645134 RepID=A0A0L0HEX3_SPIPD|nr:CAMK/CAMKL/MARK protein kinase [Spizellomyces punctatus DAOM BR117]KNC99632.1 CAMK/CAMKL/MARK protein kinase [Spizellomyces punctatus DAOM BR117]|eukprot:XP_016607672.1 CAMK/CAMKL/MARK protein kinase [Spizellomyces punctatus DAOM BR117]